MRLLTITSVDDVNRLLAQYRNESEAILKEIATLCFYMRGGITWSEAMQMSPNERKILSKIIVDGYKHLQKISPSL